MNNKLTNIGLQCMPMMLCAASVAYYAMAAYVLCITCFILAIVMFLLLWGEHKGL